jgi:anti-sigma-K factor RskA
VVGSGLPDLSGDRVYELWFQPQPSAKMQPAGIFTAKDGRVVAPVTVGSSFVALAVSVEPPGGSPQPTTTPILLVSA